MLTQPEPITPTCPRAVRRAVMLQGWHDLTAVHWRYDPEVVQRLLPPGFRADTFDGSAWVGLIPFHMRRIRVPHLPALGPLSTFPETNVRTYVVDPRGRRGVWFFSLDITRLIPALVARVTYRLPYCWAQMSIAHVDDEIEYHSRRRWPRGEASSLVRVKVGAALDPAATSDLDHFLSARWALGSVWTWPGARRARLLWADVDHPPWPLHEAEILDCDAGLVAAAGLPAPALGAPAVVRWSPGVEVRIQRPRLVAADLT